MPTPADASPALQVLVWLYALVPVVSAVAWVPQIVRLLRYPQLASGMSLWTWAVWTGTALVGLAYVLWVVGDALLVAVFAVNAVGQVVVLVCAVLARLRSSGLSAPPPTTVS